MSFNVWSTLIKFWVVSSTLRQSSMLEYFMIYKGNWRGISKEGELKTRYQINMGKQHTEICMAINFLKTTPAFMSDYLNV